MLYYRAALKATIDQPAFYVVGTDRVTGGVHRIGPGLVLLLPAIHIPDNYSVQRRGGLERRFIDTLIELLDERRRPEDVALPAWTDTYLVPGESQLVDKLQKLEWRRQDIIASIDTCSKDLEALRR